MRHIFKDNGRTPDGDRILKCPLCGAERLAGFDENGKVYSIKIADGDIEAEHASWLFPSDEELMKG